MTDLLTYSVGHIYVDEFSVWKKTLRIKHSVHLRSHRINMSDVWILFWSCYVDFLNNCSVPSCFFLISKAPKQHMLTHTSLHSKQISSHSNSKHSPSSCIPTKHNVDTGSPWAFRTLALGFLPILNYRHVEIRPWKTDYFLMLNSSASSKQETHLNTRNASSPPQSMP